MDGGISAGDDLRGQWGHSEKMTELREEWAAAWPDLMRLAAGVVAGAPDEDGKWISDRTIVIYRAMGARVLIEQEEGRSPSGEQK